MLSNDKPKPSRTVGIPTVNDRIVDRRDELSRETVDVQYTDNGEKECGVPANLVRKPGTKGNETVKPRPIQSTPSRRRKGTKEVARQCYDLIKTFSEKEQEAALQMLQALDTVRTANS